MHFDQAKADRARQFIGLLTHTKGKWMGQRFGFIPWQIDLINDTYGSLRADGFRQYRFIYLEIPKKSGKSELGAAIGLQQLIADGENGAEVYSAAGDRHQASIVFNVAAQMVKQDPILSNRLTVLHSIKRIIDHKTNSFYQVLSAEVETKHGLNPSCVLFDEIHSQPHRRLWDVLTVETDAARDQQLVVIMTTAGVYDPLSIGWEVHEYARQVKDGIIEDPQWLPIMYCAENDSDWKNRDVWKANNPSLGHIMTMEKLEQSFVQVMNNPAKLNGFKRFRLNMWVSSVEKWLPMDDWDMCDEKVDVSKLLGRDCYAGLDLSSKVDLTAKVLLFPPIDENESWKIIPQFYMPSDNLAERARIDKVPYELWAESGLITLTQGNVIDYKFMIKDLVADSRKYRVMGVGYDPFSAQQVANELSDEHGLPMTEFRQGWRSMSEPTKEVLAMTKKHQFAHGGNPVLRWCANNLQVKIGANETVQPVKDRTYGRIDGMIGLIEAVGMATLTKPQKPSVYETRGLRML